MDRARTNTTVPIQAGQPFEKFVEKGFVLEGAYQCHLFPGPDQEFVLQMAPKLEFWWLTARVKVLRKSGSKIRTVWVWKAPVRYRHFGTSLTYRVNYRGHYTVEIKDFNGDGNPDILASAEEDLAMGPFFQVNIWTARHGRIEVLQKPIDYHAYGAFRSEDLSPRSSGAELIYADFILEDESYPEPHRYTIKILYYSPKLGRYDYAVRFVTAKRYADPEVLSNEISRAIKSRQGVIGRVPGI